jgi:hypothetical protein
LLSFEKRRSSRAHFAKADEIVTRNACNYYLHRDRGRAAEIADRHPPNGLDPTTTLNKSGRTSRQIQANEPFTELARVVYCLFNVGLLFAAVILLRHAYAMFGAFGSSLYLGDLESAV